MSTHGAPWQPTPEILTAASAASLFIIAQLQNQPRGPAAEELMEKMQAVCTAEFDSAVKPREVGAGWDGSVSKLLTMQA